MASKDALLRIRKGIEEHLGQTITIRTNKGRRRVVERRGVLESAYPSIFLVRLDDERCLGRRVSFSYSDILTQTVEVSLGDSALRPQAEGNTIAANEA
ncbi:MAG TPA: Veg protein [Clostridia bacterium]|nr:Veg protein [Clostridia bacterium]